MPTGKITFEHLKIKDNDIANKEALPQLVIESKPKQIDKKISGEARKKRIAQLKELRKLLHASYPEVFNYTHPKPLAIGIHKEIKIAFPQYSQKLIREFMARWIKDKRYLAALTNTTHRINLSNVLTSEITSTEKEFLRKKMNTLND